MKKKGKIIVNIYKKMEVRISKKEALKRALASLPYHLEKYNECKYQSKHASRKADRDKALDDMFVHANAMKNDLTIHPDIYAIIKDDSPFQFEDFNKFAASDVPDYIRKLEDALEKIKDDEEL